jgi:hypothetical protein
VLCTKVMIVLTPRQVVTLSQKKTWPNLATEQQQYAVDTVVWSFVGHGCDAECTKERL